MLKLTERLRRIGDRVPVPCPDDMPGCLVNHFRIETNPTCAEAADHIEDMERAAEHWRTQYSDLRQSARSIQTGLQHASVRLRNDLDRLEAQIRGLTAENKKLRTHLSAAESAGFVLPED